MLDLDQHLNRVSGIFKEISVGRIRRVVEKTESEGHLVHGVIRPDGRESILKQGVKPAIQDHGGVSFWTRGLRMFTASENPNGSLFGFDSSLLSYGTEFLVLTNTGLLSGLGISPRPVSNGAFVIDAVVSREVVAILDVTAHSDRSGRKMFELLEKVLHRGYVGGEHIKG